MSTERDRSSPPTAVAVIPAAGAGARMGTDRVKQFLDLGDKPMLAVTLEPFQHCSAVNAIVLVVPSRHVDYCRKEIVERFKLDKVKSIAPGGSKRQDSVRLGLEATKGAYDLVLIHDGVRPLLDTAFIARVIEAAKQHRAVITGLRAKETVKEVNHHQKVVQTYDRRRVWLIQTPQVFRYEDIYRAHQKALQEGAKEATDDALLIERLGIPVTVIEGSETNIKVTTPQDLELAHLLLRRNIPAEEAGKRRLPEQG